MGTGEAGSQSSCLEGGGRGEGLEAGKLVWGAKLDVIWGEKERKEGGRAQRQKGRSCFRSWELDLLGLVS